MHVLSTPPAFVLSQDQTLHKRALSALALRDILAICQQANRFITLLKNRLGSYYLWKLRAYAHILYPLACAQGCVTLSLLCVLTDLIREDSQQKNCRLLFTILVCFLLFADFSAQTSGLNHVQMIHSALFSFQGTPHRIVSDALTSFESASIYYIIRRFLSRAFF